MAALLDPAAITDYHAHIYFEDAAARERAAALRAQLAEAFPAARLGNWHERPVGPHTMAMYQVAFPPELFPTLVPWLLLNRDGLTVLLHPETGDDYTDHAEHAAWLGQKLALNLEMLRKQPG
ncbi:MAG TPA: DOPA 4,5-dioxygenase family protein [Aliidongia sp.]|nr:DOPA 4,5-dioxygenase family protein [Aliidongia sp.]